MQLESRILGPVPVRYAFVALVAACAFAGCSRDLGTPSARSDQQACAAFTFCPLKNGTTSAHLRALWGFGDTQLFAVGDEGMVLRHDGTRWQAMSSGTEQTLFDIWGSRPDDIYAVGDGGTIVHFDGTRWRSLPSPTNASLAAIWGTAGGVVIAVGSSGTIVRRQLDDTFRLEPSGTQESLFAVWIDGDDSAYAAGLFGTLLYYRSGVWISEASETTEHLFALWGNGSGDVFTGGTNGYLGRNRGAAAFETQSTHTSIPFTAIWGTPTAGVVAVGYNGMQRLFDGTRWMDPNPPSEETAHFHLVDLWGDGNRLYALRTGVDEQTSTIGRLR